MKPIIPALHLADLTDSEVDTFAQEKIDKLTGNTHYPDISSFPELQGMSNLLTSYRTALAKAEDGTSVDVEDKDAKRNSLEASLIALAIRCVQLSGNDKVIFHSSGFETRKERSPVKLPPRPEDFASFEGHSEGVIDLIWSPVPDSVVYHLDMTETPHVASSWTVIPVARGGVCTKANTSITGLTPGNRYWFRVAAFNSAGLGEWSEPATRISQ